jgi:thioredoxin reductase
MFCHVLSTGKDKQTSVPGVYAAGDATILFSSISIALAEETFAGVFINKALIAENLA